MQHAKEIDLINRTIFPEAKSKVSKNRGEEWSGEGKTPNYLRYCELEQDIASMSGIVVFIKLTQGLTDYPFLFQCALE